jgi:hypothetical protein
MRNRNRGLVCLCLDSSLIIYPTVTTRTVIPISIEGATGLLLSLQLDPPFVPQVVAFIPEETKTVPTIDNRRKTDVAL